MQKCAEEGHALAEKAGRDDLVAGLLGWLGAGRQAQGDLASATNFFDRALARAGGYCSVALGNYPLTLYLSGRIPEAVQRGQEATETYRSLGDNFAAAFSHPHLGLALAASGRYSEATRVFEEARQLGLKYEVWSFHARAIAMSAGFHLDVFDFKGNELLAEEARESALSKGFQASQVSADLDLVFNYARRGGGSRVRRMARMALGNQAKTGACRTGLRSRRLARRFEMGLGRRFAEPRCWPYQICGPRLGNSRKSASGSRPY